MSILIKHGGQAPRAQAERAWHSGSMSCRRDESRPPIGRAAAARCKAAGDWRRHFLSDYLCAALAGRSHPARREQPELGPCCPRRAAGCQRSQAAPAACPGARHSEILRLGEESWPRLRGTKAAPCKQKVRFTWLVPAAWARRKQGHRERANRSGSEVQTGHAGTEISS